ncbi:hypothetical protein [Arenimonas malthae]|uniref:hypothetical protein n=1 Tax=Arenimonas malthae TaxID=354197 RepID=UPI0012EB0D7B|nr:hypothetical protein [Arenimonas malthae]
MAAATSCAKGERDLAIGEDGALRAIPPSFGKTYLHIEGLETSSPVIAFKAGNTTNSLPPCATRIVGSHSIDHISASGSWDHDARSFPHFVRVNLYEDYGDERFDYAARIEIIFDLKTTGLFDIKRFVKLPNSQWERMEELNFPRDCNPLMGRPNQSFKPTSLRDAA